MTVSKFEVIMPLHLGDNRVSRFLYFNYIKYGIILYLGKTAYWVLEK